MKWTRVRSLSAYARAESHLVQKTNYGAIVTICGALLALILFASEAKEYWTPYTLSTMGVDTVREQHLTIHIKFEFPSLPCQALSLDAVDVSGEAGGDISLAKNGELHKIRLNPDGSRKAVGEYVAPRHFGFTLRKSRAQVDAINQAFKDQEGCLVYGWLRVQRVAGNLHISVHMDDYIMLESAQKALAAALSTQTFGGAMPNLPVPEGELGLNMSHTIHTLAFGDEYPEIVNPLDGAQRIITKSAGIFKYFLKVVPTKYKHLHGKVLNTNQYSVTEYDSPATTGDLQLPSVWFLYDLSPVTVTIAQTRRSILHLLTRFCAVVGGVFAVTGMLDRVVHRLVKSIFR